MQKAIFLDRDGILIKIKKYNNKPYSVDDLSKLKFTNSIKLLLKK